MYMEMNKHPKDSVIREACKMVHYITSWARNADKHHLRQFPAASTKSEYVTEALKQVSGNEKVRVLSLAQTLHRKWYMVPPIVEQVDEKETDETIPSIGSPFRCIRALNVIILNVYLLFYLLFRVKTNDIVVVYHSYAYATAMVLAHKIKKLSYILEVEEIYQDVFHMSNRLQRAEYDVFRRAVAYIFSSTLLNDKVNVENKPAAVSHGTYRTEKDRGVKFTDGKIHVAYAGTLNPKKGSLAAAGLSYLPSNYRVHILGHGSSNLIQRLKEKVLSHKVVDGAQVSYDGFFSGEEYIRFIQACDIGLCTQDPDASFTFTSFPSKILSYMANGLRVVSVSIDAVKFSAVGDMITYYDEQTPESIAKAIMSVDMSQPYDSRKRIAELDRKFQIELKQLIEAR